LAGTLSELVERWRAGLANALGDVEVQARLKGGAIELIAPFREGDQRLYFRVTVSVDTWPTEQELQEHLEILAEEAHDAGYPRP
jgi:hypothetical protein